MRWEIQIVLRNIYKQGAVLGLSNDIICLKQ